MKTNYISQNRHFSFLVLLVLLASSISTVLANEVIQRLATFRDTPTNKHESLIIDPSTTEQFDPNTGTISFEAVDISIPGNFNIPVELRRVYKPGGGNTSPLDERYANYTGDSLHSFGKRSTYRGGTWSLDIPYVKGYFIQPLNTSVSVSSGGWKDGYVCSQSYTNATNTVFNGSYTESAAIEPQTYWQGKVLHIPGKVSEPFIQSTQSHAYNEEVTLSNYKLDGCFTISGGAEGIRVKSPDGLTYEFGHYLDFVDVDDRPTGVNHDIVRRHVVVTKITDAFGNYVTYNWSGKKLLSITSSDNRTIAFGYGYSNNINSATAGGNTWTYGHSEGSLEVWTPDGRQYKYNTWKYFKSLAYSDEHLPPGGTGTILPGHAGNCAKDDNNWDVNFNIVLPSGAKVEYTLRATYHGKARTRPLNQLTGKGFFGWSSTLQYSRPSNLKCSIYYSLHKKVITGPNLPTMTWDYEYSENQGSYKAGYDYATASELSEWSIADEDIPSTVTNLYDYKTTTVRGPDAVQVFFINRKQDNSREGKTVAVNTYDASGNTLLKQEATDYSTLQNVGNHYFYPDNIFLSLSSLNKMTLENRVLSKKVTTKYYLSGGVDTYYFEQQSYDIYGNVTQTKAHNSFNSSERYNKYTYLTSAQDWRFGLPLSTTQGPSLSNMTETKRFEYHSGSNTGQYSGKYLLYKIYEFNRWKYLYKSYHSDGNAKRIEFNAKMINSSGIAQSTNRFIELHSYARGNARTVKMPARYDHNATITSSYGIDYFGQITNYTDFNGNWTNYKYSDDGFVSAIIKPYPFNAHIIDWFKDSDGAWRRSVRECDMNISTEDCNDGTVVNNNTIVFDGLYRPIRHENEDISTGEKIYRHFEYDSHNNNTLTTVPSYSSNLMTGKLTEFDALSRPTKITQIGGEETLFTYKANNTKEVKNPRQYVTTTRYLAYGSPTNLPDKITSPESVVTTLSYDDFDNVTFIMQSGPGGTGEPSVFGQEQRYYNTYNQLCMISRADTGNIVFNRNAMGEVTGKKTGSFSSTSCAYHSHGSFPVYTLDNHGSIKKMEHFGDGPDVTQTLDKNGNILVSNVGTNVTTTYTYNQLNIPKSETMIVNGKSLTLAYDYTNSGNIHRVHYPNDDVVEYRYNGRGQQISVRRLADDTYSSFTYAKDAKYFANGVLKEFTYGNDVVHTKTLDSEYKVHEIKDARNTTKINHLRYAYDKNDNIKNITDLRDSRYSLNSLTYDGLDRLTDIAGGSIIGNTELEYDSLGNITFYKTKNSTLVYNYDRSFNRNRLASVTGTGSASKSYSSFSYDSRGNVTNNSHNSFSYNALGQMYSSGSFSYVYDGNNRRVYQVDFNGQAYSLYGYDGTLRYLEKSNGGTNHIYLNGNIIARDGIERSENGRQRYKAFGESIDGATENVGYTGHKYDTALELNYMQARYYDPVIGRFYSNDPVGWTPQNPVMSFNRYLYVNNNPYKYTDPNGEFLNFAVKFVADVALGAALNYAETGSVNLGGAVADAALGALNPAKTVQKAQRLAKVIKGGCSFTPETMILTKDGYKTIIEVNVGDIVLSKNDETGEVSWREVTDTFKDWHTETITFTVVDENGTEESITTTAEHPFYVDNQGWLPAGDVSEGTVISGPKADNNISIVSIQVNNEPQYAYNFTVDTDHTYFVGKTNMWVHNACKIKSASQMQQKVEKNQAPKGIERFDSANTNVKSSQDHVHKTDGTSMNVDGTVHDKKNGVPEFTNKEQKFLKENGWPTKVKDE